MQPAQFLKTLVIVLGVAIVVAVGFVIYGFVRLSEDMAMSDAAASVAPASFDVADLGQPTGTTIAQIVPLAGERVMIALTGGAVPDRAVIFDLKAGRVVGTIHTSMP
ncbi:MAG: hypothetical protein SFV19_18300 [Rhodospirillaceae bacterium]|nr:hypothetical protein [Rhodospirillaceae bacterium]